MGLSDINFTTDEMREMQEAADLSFRRKPHEKASRPPKGTQLTALKLMAEKGNAEAVAVIAGISVEQLRSIIA